MGEFGVVFQNEPVDVSEEFSRSSALETPPKATTATPKTVGCMSCASYAGATVLNWRKIPWPAG